MFIRQVKVLLILVLVSVAFVAIGAADEANQQIDAIFAQPPPAELSAEQAAPVINQLEQLAESVPARKLEIDAFLIPYRRAVGAPEQAASASPAATPAALKPKPLLFVKTPGMKLAIRAVSVTPQGFAVVVETADGKRSMYQREFVESPLSWFTDAEMESGVLDLARLAARYESYMAVFPEGRPVLDAEVKKMKAVLANSREARRKREEEIQNKLAGVLGQMYDEDSEYTRDELARILLDADMVRKAQPVHAVEIDQVVAPFREHFENLLAGKVCVGGVWKTKEEIEAAAKKRLFEDKRLSFEQNLTIPFDALALSESQIFQSLKMPVAILGLLVAAGLVLLSQRKHLLLAALLVLVPTAGAVYYLFLLTSGSSSIGIVRTPGGANPGKISRLLFLSSLSDRTVFTKDDELVSFTDQDLNEFLRGHLKFVNDPGGKSAGIYVTDLAVEIVPRGFVVIEQVRYKGHFYCIRYDVEVVTRKRQPVIADCSVKFGNAAITIAAKQQLWSALREQLEKIDREHSLFRDFVISTFKESELQLALKTPEPEAEKVQTASVPAATPAPTPKPAPAEAATPATSPAEATEPAPEAPPAMQQQPATDTPTPEPAAEPSMSVPTQPEPATEPSMSAPAQPEPQGAEPSSGTE